jgi:hypothetical protein
MTKRTKHMTTEDVRALGEQARDVSGRSSYEYCLIEQVVGADGNVVTSMRWVTPDQAEEHAGDK